MRILTGLLWITAACPLIAWVVWTGFGAPGVVALGLAALLAGILPALGGKWGLALLAAMAALGSCALLLGAYIITVFPANW